jgi:hypothetical protein
LAFLDHTSRSQFGIQNQIKYPVDIGMLQISDTAKHVHDFLHTLNEDQNLASE